LSKPKLDQYNISGENWREYVYSNYVPPSAGDTEISFYQTVYKIEEPQILFIKRDEFGEVVSHRVVDSYGIAHYPEPGWTAIRWFDPDNAVSF
jgi:hypothetical protein